MSEQKQYDLNTREGCMDALLQQLRIVATLTAERDSAKRELAELLADAKVERTKYEALKLERDTERGLRESSEQENDRLRTERDSLKAQVARIRQPRVYEGATFYTQAGVPEICPDCDGRNFVSYGVRGMVCWTCCLMRDLEELETQVARLSAPVTDAEWGKTYWSDDGGMRGFVNTFIAARTAPAKETECPKCGGIEKVQAGDMAIHECDRCYHCWDATAPAKP